MGLEPPDLMNALVGLWVLIFCGLALVGVVAMLMDWYERR